MLSPPICSGLVQVEIAPVWATGATGAVHVQAHRAAVVRLRQKAPSVGRQRGAAEGVAVGAAGDHTPVGPGAVGRGRLQVEVVVAFVDHVAPVAFTVDGFTQASSVIPVVRLQRGGVGTVTSEFVLLNEAPCRTCPPSPTSCSPPSRCCRRPTDPRPPYPDPSSNPNAATNPGCAALAGEAARAATRSGATSRAQKASRRATRVPGLPRASVIALVTRRLAGP